MIRHIVMWKLAGDDDAAKTTAFEAIAGALRPLAHLDGIHSLTVERNGVGIVDNYDAALVGDYESEAALRNYLEHPEHVAAVVIVRQNVTGRAAIDYELPAL